MRRPPSATGARTRERPRLLTWRTYSNQRRYRRTIDLGKLYDFPGPGTYKVQVTYDDHRVADREREEWPGGFDGRTLTVTID